MIFIVKQTATVIKDGDGGSESKRRHTTRPNKIVKLLCYTLDMVNFCKWYLDGSIGQVCMCVWITNTSLFLSYFGLCFICSVSALYLPCVSPSLLPPPPPPPHPPSLIRPQLPPGSSLHIISVEHSSSTFFTHFSSFIVSVRFQLCLRFCGATLQNLCILRRPVSCVVYVFRFSAHCKQHLDCQSSVYCNVNALVLLLKCGLFVVDELIASGMEC